MEALNCEHLNFDTYSYWGYEGGTWGKCTACKFTWRIEAPRQSVFTSNVVKVDTDRRIKGE